MKCVPAALYLFVTPAQNHRAEMFVGKLNLLERMCFDTIPEYMRGSVVETVCVCVCA